MPRQYQLDIVVNDHDAAPAIDAVVAAEQRLVAVSQTTGKALTEQELATRKLLGINTEHLKGTEMLRTAQADATDTTKKAGEATDEHEKSTKKAKESQNEFGKAIQDVERRLLSFMAVRAAVNFINTTLHEASALQDLSRQTHINVEELQLLAGAMSKFGVDSRELGNSLFSLSRKIAGSDESIARALAIMGMTLEDVRQLNGQELFLTIERGLAKLQGSLRDTVSADLFGSRLGAAMAGASEGIDDAMEHAKRFNTVVSQESVAAAAEYAEAIDRIARNAKALAMSLAGETAIILTGIADGGQKAAQIWTEVWGAFTGPLFTLGPRLHALALALSEVNQGQEQRRRTTEGVALADRQVIAALTEQQIAARFLHTFELNAAAALEPWQIKNLERLKEMGALNAKNAEAIGVNIVQFEKYKASLEQNADAYRRHEQTVKLWADAMKRAHESAYDNMLKLQNQTEQLQLERMNRVNAQILANFEAQTRLNAAQGLDAHGAILTQVSALDTLEKALAKLHAVREEGISQRPQEIELERQFTDALKDEALAMEATYLAVLKKTREETTSLTTANREMALSFQAVVSGIEPTHQQLVDYERELRAAYAAAGIFMRDYMLSGPRPPNVPPASAGFAGGGSAFRPSPGGASAFSGGGGGGGGASVTITNTFHIVDTESNIAQRVSDRILKSVTQGRKLGID